MRELYRANTFIEVISLMRNARRHGTLSYSYRQLADKLGYRSPRSLAMVHKGQRLPSRSLVGKITRHLDLEPHEKELVTLLAEKAIAERKKLVTAEMNESIKRLQDSVQRICMIEEAEVDQPVTGSLFLNAAEFKTVRKQLLIFLIELTSRYGERNGACGDASSKYEIDLQIYLDTT
jgi:hypothetical protein